MVYLMQKPGSKGERQLQEELGTTRRARAFYKQQMRDYLNPSIHARVHFFPANGLYCHL